MAISQVLRHYNQPSDFTPLLKAKNLSGVFSVNVRSEPSPSLPDIVPNRPLAGRHFGKEWKGLFTYKSSFPSDDNYFDVNVIQEEEPEAHKRFQLRQLMIKLPKNPENYKLSPTFNVTFYQHPGNNKTATDGILKITQDGSTYKAHLIAHFDEDNTVQGYFTFQPTKEKIARCLCYSQQRYKKTNHVYIDNYIVVIRSDSNLAGDSLYAQVYAHENLANCGCDNF